MPRGLRSLLLPSFCKKLLIVRPRKHDHPLSGFSSQRGQLINYQAKGLIIIIYHKRNVPLGCDGIAANTNAIVVNTFHFTAKTQSLSIV